MKLSQEMREDLFGTAQAYADRVEQLEIQMETASNLWLEDQKKITTLESTISGYEAVMKSKELIDEQRE